MMKRGVEDYDENLDQTLVGCLINTPNKLLFAYYVVVLSSYMQGFELET